MERYEGLKYSEYRKVPYFDGDELLYVIEKRKGNKWVYCFGGIDHKTANNLLDNPHLITSQIKTFRATAYFILGFLTGCVIYFLTK